MSSARAPRSALPGFGLTLGFTVAYLGLIVLIPLSAAFIKTAGMSWARFRGGGGVAPHAGLVPAELRHLAARRLGERGLRFHPGLGAGALHVSRPPDRGRLGGPAVCAADRRGGHRAGRHLLAARLGGAVAGAATGIKVAYTPLGVYVALTFIGLPFVVRTLQPVLQELDPELEEAAATLGANRWQTITRVILPELLPGAADGLHAGVRARAGGIRLGGFHRREHAHAHRNHAAADHDQELEQYDYRGATALAVVMLLASFSSLLLINLLQKWSARAFFTAFSHPEMAASVTSTLSAYGETVRAPRRGRRMTPCLGALRRSSRSRCCSSAVSSCCRWSRCSPRRCGKGWGAYFAAFTDPDALSAIKLTLLDGGDRGAVQPRLRHRRGLVHREIRFQRKKPSHYADRPAVRRLAGHLGPDLCAFVRRAGLVRALSRRGRIRGSTYGRSFSPCRASCWRRCS